MIVQPVIDREFHESRQFLSCYGVAALGNSNQSDTDLISEAFVGAFGCRDENVELVPVSIQYEGNFFRM